MKNKKFLSTLLILGGVLVSSQAAIAADLKPALERKISNIVLNQNAIENNLRIDFEITESVYREDSPRSASYWGRESSNNTEMGPYKAKLSCKAYALDSHWLILSSTCMRYGNDEVVIYDQIYPYRTGRTIHSSFNVAEFPVENAIPAQNMALKGNLMLLWTDNEELAASLETLPKANVLAVSSPNQLFALSADNIFKINTARLGTDGVRIRTLKNNSVNGNKFQLNDKWTDLSGTATDPLFLVTRNGNEFLVGYNDGMLLYALRFPRNDSIWDYQGKPSKDYFSLNLEDLNFIKETVLKERPQDWERIKERLFYNKIKSPYFQ